MGRFTSDLEQLFARADAALDEAARLRGESLLWQKILKSNVNRLWKPGYFSPKTIDFYSPYRLPPPPDRLECDPDMIALRKAITRIQETYAEPLSPARRGRMRVSHRSQE